MSPWLESSLWLWLADGLGGVLLVLLIGLLAFGAVVLSGGR